MSFVLRLAETRTLWIRFFATILITAVFQVLRLKQEVISDLIATYRFGAERNFNGALSFRPSTASGPFGFDRRLHAVGL